MALFSFASTQRAPQ